MYKDLLRSIAGVEVFPIISLGMFLVVFTLMVVSAFRMDSRRASRLARLPLEDRAPETNKKEVTL